MRSTPLGALLFGKTRRTILALMLGRPEEAFYVRQVARLVASGNGVVQRELEELAAGGILTRRPSGRQVYFQANTNCPIFPELKSLIVKTAGVADILREALTPFSEHISVAFVYGSIAAGRERATSDVDVMVIGEVSFTSVAEGLATAQEQIGREINPTVYPVAEFRKKVAARQSFLAAALKGEKLFLIGDRHELEKLVG